MTWLRALVCAIFDHRTKAERVIGAGRRITIVYRCDRCGLETRSG